MVSRISVIILFLLFTLGSAPPPVSRPVQSSPAGHVSRAGSEPVSGKVKFNRISRIFIELPGILIQASAALLEIIPRDVTPIPVEKEIIIDLENQRLYRLENGRIVAGHPVSSGVPGHRTPRGKFKIRNKAPSAWSNKYECTMLNWMAFTPDGLYGLHALTGTRYLKKLGTPASHGCVRLSRDAAIELYEWAEIGTPVIIHSRFDPKPPLHLEKSTHAEPEAEPVVF